MTYNKNFPNSAKIESHFGVGIFIIFIFNFAYFLIEMMGFIFKHILFSPIFFFESLEESYYTNSSYFY